MIHPKKIEVFVDQLEDEICKRTDIDSFEEFMVALAKELGSRYMTPDIDADRLAEKNTEIRTALIGSTRWMQEWNERWRFMDDRGRLEFCFEMNRLINKARAALAAHEEVAE